MTNLTAEVSNPSIGSKIVHLLELSILILTVFGNTTLILVLVKIENLKHCVNKLILNLALCNLLLVLVSIPSSLAISYSAPNYPFGNTFCKSIGPLATYATNAEIFTLMAIAIDRWHVVSNSILRGAKQMVMVCSIHCAAILLVVPFIYTLETTMKKDGLKQCVETWSLSSSRVYTLVLFVSQYATPVSVIFVLYTKSWITIQRVTRSALASTQDEVIAANHEECNECLLQQSRTSSTSSTRTFTVCSIPNPNDSDDDNCFSSDNTSKSECCPFDWVRKPLRSSLRRRSSVFLAMRKFSAAISLGGGIKFDENSIQSRAIRRRILQSRAVLRLFTFAVTVFILFMLPNEILWLYKDFSMHPNESVNSIIADASYLLTYANCVLHPLVYCGFNKRFRKGYANLFTSCFR